MASMTFQINDYGGTAPAVWVTVTENSDGTLRFDAEVKGTYTGDLRGLFFDISDESILSSLKVAPLSGGFTELRLGNDTVKDLGDGANMNGMLGTTDTAGFDVGIEIGTAGIGKDDYQRFSFVLDSTLRDLTLADLGRVDFGARLTSVGDITGIRADSSKILEVTSVAVSAQDNSALILENASSTTGNVLANDMSGLAVTDRLSVTSWSGGALGQAIVLNNAEGATLTLNADGSYVLDASRAEALSAGERLEFTFDYNIKDMHEATSWSTDMAHLNITIEGVNDGPEAANDIQAPILENAIATGNLLANDHDVDRLDTIHVTTINGVALNPDGPTSIQLASGAYVTIAADGSFTYDTHGAFDALMSGEFAMDGFEYAIADNHGAVSVARAEFRIDGVGSPEPPPPPPEPPTPPEPPGPELPGLGLSHGYWMTHDGYPNPDDWNIAHNTSFEQFFGIDAGDWIQRDGRTTLSMADVLFDQALELQGGDKYALAREGVTAVLNAMDEKNGVVYDFAYTVDEVKSLVYDALASNDAAVIESTKDLLEASHH